MADIEYQDIQVVDVQGNVEIEETVEIVDVIDVDPVQVDMLEAFPSAGDNNDNNHALLNNRELNDQHPITAITGLRDELDRLEALQTVYSDKAGVANYYKWNDGAYDECGYFVSLVPGTSHIKICNDGEIFGVTVDAAAFIGGQDGITLDYVNGVTDNHGSQRDNSYALVATTGLVDVRCESDVTEGDYVVSNEYGVASKTTSGYGFKVVAVNNKFGVLFASIALGVQACTTDILGKNFHKLDERVSNNEINIAAAMNVANEAYSKSNECIKSNDEVSSKVDEALGVVGDVSATVESLGSQMSSTTVIAVQAKAIAESAATSAESIRNDAIKTATDALTKAGEIEKMVEPINNWEYTDPVTGITHTGATYFAEYVSNGLSTKAEMETVSRLDAENKLLIEKNAESLQQMLSSVDKYSVGEFSQAYGLTLEQARSILNDGMVYIPTPHGDANTHTEGYVYGENQTLTREFTYGFYYVWTTLEDGESMWSEAIGQVWFGKEQPAGSAYTYWYDGDKLYLLVNGQWTEVAMLAGNVNNRITSMIRQTADEVAMEVVNARGSSATLGARITNTESEVNSLAAWTKDEDGNQYNLATIKQTADEAGADIALVVQEKDGEKVINSASIVAAINDDESSVGINADRITMTGTTTFLQPEDVGENGSTVINGSLITTGTLDAEKVKVINLQASNIIVTGNGGNNQTVDEVLANTLVSSTIYYALSTSTKIPPADDAWSETPPEKERKKYMWQKTVNVYGDGSSEEKVVCIAGADGDGAIVVDIKSSTGTIYINSDIQTVLIATVYQDNEDITNEFPDGAFLWEKYDMYGTKDSVWSYTGKQVAVSNLDIYKRAMFNCVLDIDQRT